MQNDFALNVYSVFRNTYVCKFTFSTTKLVKSTVKTEIEWQRKHCTIVADLQQLNWY